MEIFVLTKEHEQAFYPILPDNMTATNLREGIVLLGACEVNAEGVEQACGSMVLQQINDVTWVIKWIFVSPDFTRRGIGSALLETAKNLCEQMQMQLFCLFSEETEMYALRGLFEKAGFELKEKEGKSYSVSVGQVGYAEYFEKKQSADAKIKVLSQVSQKQLDEFNRAMYKEGKLFVNPLDKQWPLQDVSVVYVENKKILACVIMEQLEENIVSLSFACAQEKAAMRLFLLLYKAQELLREKYPPETELVIPCVTGVSRKLVETILPNAQVTLQSYSARWMPN